MGISGQKTPLGQPRLRKALAQVRNEAEALKDEELLLINLDPFAAVTTVSGALPKMVALREQIAADLPRFNLALLDNLELYSLALMQAHSLFNAARGEQNRRGELAVDADKLRALLLADANNLKQHGFLANADLSQLRGPNGHRNIACDVMTLASLLRKHWTQVSSHCGVTLADLDRAEVLSDELAHVIGVHERATEEFAAAALLRKRVFTLFIRAYTEVRTAVKYVNKATGGTDKFPPAVHNRRKSTKKAPVGANAKTTSQPAAEATASPSAEAIHSSENR
jgi:hypothetical protein